MNYFILHLTSLGVFFSRIFFFSEKKKILRIFFFFFQIFLVTDLLFGHVKRQHLLVHGSSMKIDGEPARLSLEWTVLSDITQNALFSRRSFWKFNFLAITEEGEIYLIILISKQCMESCKFPSTYTIISGLLDDVNNSKTIKFWVMSLLYVLQPTLMSQGCQLLGFVAMGHYFEGSVRSLSAPPPFRVTAAVCT